MTLRRLKRELSWDELHLWIAYERVEPFEDGWIQSGKLISLIANMFNGKRAVKLGDVYPHLREPEKSPKELEAYFRSWAGVHNARVAREEPSP